MDISQLKTVTDFDPTDSLPGDGIFVGRVWIPAALAVDGVAGPRVVEARDGELKLAPFDTMSDLINDGTPLESWTGKGSGIGKLNEVLADSVFPRRAGSLRDETRIVLLAPNDLLATRACGVTFVKSLLERVVEEKAKGDPEKAKEIRALILDVLGEDIASVKPGSPETIVLKEKLVAAGMWSQYLEVGIGKNAEIFTKAQPMASVGYGAQIGVLPDSHWNNPEPEVVLAVSRRGTVRGASLGNDVNLRDYEGRSALLLGEAKDQNGSCAIGPFIRLFDGDFTLEDITAMDIELEIAGEDGFHARGRNRMAEISRSPSALVAQAIGEHHQYPDGLMLFLGTMFAPTEDRDGPGQGFTHHPGDRVEIGTPQLGRLVNWVNYTNSIPRWEYGITELLNFLLRKREQKTEKQYGLT